MSDSKSGGVSVAGLLGVLFIGLKLGHVIDWSWLWVLSPFWIPAALVLSLLLIGGVLVGLGKLIENADQKRKAKVRAAKAEQARSASKAQYERRIK